MIAAIIVAATMALPVPKYGTCPSGFRESGGYCAPMNDTAPAAVPKLPGKQCPTNWRQSGDYCIRNNQPTDR